MTEEKFTTIYIILLWILLLATFANTIYIGSKNLALRENYDLATTEIAIQVEENQNLRNELREVEYILSRELGTEVVVDMENISVPSNITLSQMKSILKDTDLQGLSWSYLYAEKHYGVNALYLYSITALESGYGTSRLATEKNNLSGFGAYDHDPYNSAFTFATKSQSVLRTALTLRASYIDSGLLSLLEVGSKYASDVRWAEKVHLIAEKAKENL